MFSFPVTCSGGKWKIVQVLSSHHPSIISSISRHLPIYENCFSCFYATCFCLFSSDCPIPGSLDVPVCDGQARRDRQRALRGKGGGSRCLQSINTNTGDLVKGALNVISTTFHILKEWPEVLGSKNLSPL